MSNLALLGGEKAVKSNHEELFRWPIVTKEDEDAVLEVLRRGAMSDSDVTLKFEEEFSEWIGSKYALGFSSGTAAIHAAMFACKVGVGDEIIAPSVTYWASLLQCYSLGATPVFAEVEPMTLCIDANDIEHRITDKTKAIVAVHYVGYPCDMDAIMAIAKKHGLKVIEDVSHAQGGLYKGRRVGTIGDVGAMSLMSGKSFATGEAGILVTDDREILDRATVLGHYERFSEDIPTEYLRPYAGLPMGGYKYRMHQLSSAMGRVQLKYYDARIAEIQGAMGYFWDQLEGQKGIRAHRPPKGSGSNMGGSYFPHAIYIPEELGGLSVSRFSEALIAEGADMCGVGVNRPLHLHPLFLTCDVYGHGKPTRIANSTRDVRQYKGSLPISESINKRTICVPWFKHVDKLAIDEYIAAFKKVLGGYKELLKDDHGDPESLGGWHFHKQSNE